MNEKKRKTVEEIERIVKENEAILRERFKVKEIGIFGSYVRGEQTEVSDLDMIVEFRDENSIGGFEYIGVMTDLEDYLKRILGIKPHLASKRHAMSSDKWKTVEKEIVYVFKELQKEREVLSQKKEKTILIG